MGSAPSPTKRSPLLRSVSPAAGLVFLVLVFVAGATATLHHKGRVVAVVNDPDTIPPPPTPPPPRKILASRCGNQQQGPLSPAGAGSREPLPRGVAHETTNLEMEASLAGDPGRKQQEEPAPKNKSLLAVPVGIKNKAVVDKLVSRFPASEFTVMLFHYDGAVERWGDLAWSARAVHVAARGQTKWWFAKRFLHPDVVAPYDYVFLWDEDVEIIEAAAGASSFDPVRYLDVVRREGLQVSQPALDRASEIHHAVTARSLAPSYAEGGGSVHRGAGWVEGMVPVFSRAAWRCAWRMVQNDLVHGWGLDYKLGYCAGWGDRARSVGVVDSEYVLHRGVPGLSDGTKDTPWAGRAAVRWRSFKEMQIFERRWEAAAAQDQAWTDQYAPKDAGGDR